MFFSFIYLVEFSCNYL